MAKRFPDAPAHPERNCWGCDMFCAAGDMRCGNGSVRTEHPVEQLGPGWRQTLPAEPGAPVPADAAEPLPCT